MRGTGVGFPLHEVHDELDVHRALDGGAHDLALAHRVVPVAEGHEAARDVHAEVDRVAGPHLGAVHVPAEAPRHDRGPRLAHPRRDAEAAEERRERDFPDLSSVAGRRPRNAFFRIDLVTPDRLRKLGAEHRGSVRPDERAEARPERGHGPRPRGLEPEDPDRERVARLGALHEERPRLRVVVPGRHDLRRQVRRRLDRAVEAVLGPRDDSACPV